MVMIPTDIGVRLRAQTDTPLPTVSPVAEVAADLAEFQRGHVFSARIQEVLPQNTYKALVAGKSVTLALPEGAKAGDTLELVVVDRTARGAIVARLANSNGMTEGGGAYPFATLSRAAQVIGALLARDGETPASAVLNRGQPLLPQAPASTTMLAAQLAPQLARAVSQSGLFYEAHQVQWMQGQRPLTQLLAEPQAAHSNPELLARISRAAGAESSATPSPATGTRAESAPGPRGDEARPSTTPNTLALPTQSIPEELRPLVQQQLDAAATQRLAWHGEVWPEQNLDWEVRPDDSHSAQDAPDGERGWVTSLRLTMPRLGGVEARLHLAGKSLSIVIAAPTDGATADLRNAAPALADALAAAGLTLQGLQIAHADAG